MTALREARAAAVRRRWRDLDDDFARALPLLLDDLEAIDREHVPDGYIAVREDLTEDQLEQVKAKLDETVRTGAFGRRTAEIRTAGFSPEAGARDRFAARSAHMPREGAGTAPGRDEAGGTVNHPPGGARGAGGAAEAPARRRTARKGGTA